MGRLNIFLLTAVLSTYTTALLFLKKLWKEHLWTR